MRVEPTHDGEGRLALYHTASYGQGSGAPREKSVGEPGGTALRKHDCGQIGVGCWNGGHDRGVHHPESLDIMNASPRVNYRHPVAGRPHATGPHGMVVALRLSAHCI